jgi:hypothetical protein
MGTLFVARSARLSDWASDVGLSKHVFKVGYTEEPVEEALKQAWAGESDWTVVRQESVDGLDEAAIIERLARKEKMIDPNYYPRLKGAVGVFKVLPKNVENHILVKRAFAGEEELAPIKLKAQDFASYLIVNGRG